MVVRVFLFLLCVMLIPSTGSESGSASYRAAEYFKNGDYIKANNYFIRALSAARKEADLQRENTILLNIAALEIHSLRFQSADSIMHQLHTSSLGGIQEYHALIGIQIAHGMGVCLDSPFLKIIETYNNTEESSIIARSQLQLAECYIDNKNYNAADTLITSAQEVLEESGQILFLKAQKAFSTGAFDSAQKLFNESLLIAQSKKRYFQTALLLYHLGLTEQQLGNSTEASQYFYRSLQVFEKLKLKRWFNRVKDLISQ